MRRPRASSRDPFHQLFPRFHQMVQALPRPTIVEIGSRARSGNVNVAWLPEASTYVGFDIVEGPNVDVLGDAHALAEHFEPSSVDAVFSVSTFERLAMPWVVVAQLNRVLRTGGLLYIGSHQTWPLHDSPWDFWRFSSSAWRALLNEQTGFEIVEVAMGDSASIVADHVSLGTENLGSNPGFLGSAVIARKTHAAVPLLGGRSHGGHRAELPDVGGARTTRPSRNISRCVRGATR